MSTGEAVLNPLRRWRLPLRLARREALRHRGRSVLVLVMIALPVVGVTAADVVLQTRDVSGSESIDRRMGAAQALVTVTKGAGQAVQMPDPNDCCAAVTAESEKPLPTPGPEDISSRLGGARLLEIRPSGDTEIATAKGRTWMPVTEVDLRDPLTSGLFELVSGRLPGTAGEVVVNRAVLERGYAVGEHLDLAGDDVPADPVIVGIAESTTVRSEPTAAGPPGTFTSGPSTSRSWLVDGEPVSWSDVRSLNRIGVTVASRAVIEHPPPASQTQQTTPDNGRTIAVGALVVVMALIEVVLLAGPAFAVGARQQQRNLALMAASGAGATQTRRVVMAAAVVLGSGAAIAGAVIGIGIARIAQPVVQSLSPEWFGPFEVPWLHVAAVVGLGLLSALLASVVPAVLASRQDVVAVLAGRRADPPASRRSPLLGLLLVAVGIGGSVYGATSSNDGELWIAASAVPAVLGMILLVPITLALAVRLSVRLPLVLRYAVRDADRHRTRTVPAVAAVAATVAGVVALGIGITSDDAENRARYRESVTRGTGVAGPWAPDVDWSAAQQALRRELPPQAVVTQQRGLVDDGNTSTSVQAKGYEYLLDGTSNSFGAELLVSDDSLPETMIGVTPQARTRAAEVLRQGGVVAFVTNGRSVLRSSPVQIVHEETDDQTGESKVRKRVTVPGLLVPLEKDDFSSPVAVLSPAAAARTRLRPQTVSLIVSGARLTEQDEEDAGEALAAVAPDLNFGVELGYRTPDDTRIIRLVLVALGGVLMLGGTLTATFLALSDARPDLATLSAVGAAPRTRRGIAASYAAAVGGVGALLGATIGFIPGVAITVPLTRSYSDCGESGTACVDALGPFLDVPWLIILSLIVVLPALTALTVGLFARSRLPLASRVT